MHKDFSRPVPQELLNIEEKSRSNLFAWRGQFSPQLIECILDAYCPEGAVVLDPFAGSGTVLLEAARAGHAAFGYEINPSAWSFSKLYEFANIPHKSREEIISELREKLEAEFPVVLFTEHDLPIEEIESRIVRIGEDLSDRAKILCNALIVLLDVYNNHVSNEAVQAKFSTLAELIRDLPTAKNTIKVDLQDARCLPLESQSIDFVVTSPPYINVFNYHQNYRRSVELLGWDLLRVARSEIGSNRANRGNRLLTVVQYCIDIANALLELSRVMRVDGRAILIVGFESRVLGIPFYNADIVEEIAAELGVFQVGDRQQRVFKNRFGQSIREDLLKIVRHANCDGRESPLVTGRQVATKVLGSIDEDVVGNNKALLEEALALASRIEGTPLFNGMAYQNYHTRGGVMMVRESAGKYTMQREKVNLPAPHLAKLRSLLENPRLPQKDRPRLQQALKRYAQWIDELNAVAVGRKEAVKQLVDATNRYKKSVELDLIFDSPEDFLYRQRGQIKLDNTILEEFLPQLMFRGLNLPENEFEFGPNKTFAGLSFVSGLSNPGLAGQPSVRTKDQDFVLGKRLYIMTSFDREFQKSERLEAHLGYVCAECKTNLDKTMFQEAAATSRDLKIAVPSSLYFLVCEFLDMTPLSITSTHIDDVLIVRKAKRMSSNVRQEYRTTTDRKKHREEYSEFLDNSRYHADVFQRMIDKIQRMVDDTDPSAAKVLKRGYF